MIHEHKDEDGSVHRDSHERHEDNPGADHDHSHGAGHSHAPANFSAAFAIGTALNAAFVVAEVIYGLSARSLALLADAGHNLGDVFGLLMAWGASALANSIPTDTHTYGFRGTSILAALLNAIILMLTTGAIAWEAIRRFHDPSVVNGQTVIWIASAGILVNGITALLFMSGRKGDLNIRAAFLHMAGDAAIALGVVGAGFLILWTGLHWIDPVTSIAISAFIVWGTWGLIRDSVRLALHGVPPGIDLVKVREFLGSIPGVIEVHDLHIWGMSTTETALTAHLVRQVSNEDDALLTQTTSELHERFEIGHATIQLESPSHQCDLAPAEKV